MGTLVKTMLESGVKLGAFPRGLVMLKKTDPDKHNDFEIIIHIVVQSFALEHITPIYEHPMNTKGGLKAFNTARDVKAEKYLKEQLINIIGKLPIQIGETKC